MIRRLPLPFLLAVAAACQAPPPAADSLSNMNGGARHQWMQAELAEALALVHQPPLMDAATAAGLSTALVSLGDRMDQLATVLAQNAGQSQLADAAFGSRASQESRAVETLQQSLSLLEAQRAVFSENVAKAFLPGYKRRTAALTEAPDESPVSAPSSPFPPHASIHLDMKQGVLELTGNQLDLGIEGNGFFEIMRPNGTLYYTRAGTFRQGFNGRVYTVEGHVLTDPFGIPPDCQGISISHDGQVFSLDGDSGLSQIGMIRVHTFANPTGLEPVGSTGFGPTKQSGPAMGRQPSIQGTGEIRQGYIERANVNLTDEIVELQRVARQRAHVQQALATYGIFVR